MNRPAYLGFAALLALLAGSLLLSRNRALRSEATREARSHALEKPAHLDRRGSAAGVSPTSLPESASPSDLADLTQLPEPAGHPAWPGARALAFQQFPPVDGLSRRVTLLQPTNFPYRVYVEERLNELVALEAQRVIRRFEAVADHLLVKLRPTHSPAVLEAIVRQFEGRVRPHPTAAQLYFVDLPSAELDGVQRAVAIVSQYPEAVEYAEPDAIVRAAGTTPNDPRFVTEQWGLNNTGQDGGAADVDLDAPEAWDIRREAPDVIVAVVDSGIRYTHEDIAANMWRNPDEVAGNGRDDDHNGFIDDVHGINAIDGTSDPLDDLPDEALGVGGHGTSVAGVIGAAGNNGKGIAGVAWKVQLMALKWFNNQGAGALSDAVECMDYARVKGAAIINASWQQGGLLSDTVNQSMVDALQRLRQAGILFVASAGNDGANNDLVAHYPSNYPFDNMVAVAAGNRAGALWRKSNFGERLVDVAAPGEDILSPTSKADDDYAIVSGTSFAAPHVSGMLALLKAQFPQADHRTLVNRLLSGVDRRERLAGKVRTGGFVNLSNALRLPTVAEFPEITAFSLNDQPVASQQESSVLQGTNVVLSVMAMGAPPLVYSWKRDGKLIAGAATSSSYRIANFAASDIGEYQVAVGNPAGVATMSLRVLGVVQRPELAAAVNAPDRSFVSSGNTLWASQNTITRDGQSAGVSGRIAARQGTLASTTVLGPGKASFVWKVSSERDNDILDLLIDNVRVESISGEVDWSRKEFEISPGTHELRWRYLKDASLSKGDDKGYLDLFTFTAGGKIAPTIASQPAGQTVLAGSAVFFSVVASGSEPLTYQWQKDGNDVLNARSNRLDLLNVVAADEGRYSVIVSNDTGSVTSASARLAVTPAALPARILSHPSDALAAEGTALTITASASGTPPLFFQWSKDGLPLLGQTTPNLTLSNLTLSASGSYSLAVSNAAGTESSRGAVLKVAQLQLAPVITKQPASMDLNESEAGELTVTADGLGPFTFEWTRDGRLLQNGDREEFLISNAQHTNSGSYQVKVSSPFGYTWSSTARVRVIVTSPPLEQGSDNTNLTWCTGGDALWFPQTNVAFDGVDALQSGAITDLQASELTTAVLGPGLVVFRWKASSEFGYDYLDFYVDSQIVDGISGEWDWEEVSWSIPEGYHTLSWIYTKDASTSEGLDSGWVDQVEFVSFNTETPVIVRQPIAQSGLLEGSASLEIEAVGSQPLTYQWFKNDAPMLAANSSALMLTNLSLADEASYYVVVSNRFGHAFSYSASVYVFDDLNLADATLNSQGLSWTDYGSPPWFAQVQETADGQSAMQSSPIADEGASWLGTSVTGPGILYYSWKVSSESDYDILAFLADDELLDYIAGQTEWQDTSFLIGPGSHQLDWVYYKDQTASGGADAGWLDYVQFLPLETESYWKLLYFSPDELLEPQISGNQADPDKDGHVNLTEYAFGLDPRAPSHENVISSRMVQTPDGTFFEVSFPRRVSDPTLTYQLEISTDLSVWAVPPDSAWSKSVTPAAELLEGVHARFLTPIRANAKLFCRVKVTATLD